MLAGFGMEADERGAGPGEVGHDAVHRLDHQMHVDRRGDAVLAQRLAHQRADGEVGHVVVVHHVEVHPVGAGREHAVHVLAQPGEIGGEDGGRDDGGLAHGSSLGSGSGV